MRFGTHAPRPGHIDLDEHLAAQSGRVYERALDELRAGRKRGCWSWYVIPQLTGAQSSGTSIAYSIPSLDDARTYLAHPILGPRLTAIVEACLTHPDLEADDVMGRIDAEKLHQCVTLFARVAADDLFAELLDQWFDGEDDVTTDRLLAGIPTPPAR